MFNNLDLNRTLANDRHARLVHQAANERLTFSARRQTRPFMFSRRPSRHP
jgi:hypothetical protein